MTENILDRLAREVFGEDRDIPDQDKSSKFDDDKYNLKKPPGFVGAVTDYINSQCRYPRENLAVLSAIVTVGNMGAMKYKMDTGGTGSNLFAFCVAGSTSGKEAVLQSVINLHVEAGMSPACHGKIKSDREIFMNLIRHQAAMYIIDEVGVELEKIINSSKPGGAAYLQSIMGTLMSIFSKSNGTCLISGDMRHEIIEELKKEHAAEAKRDDVDEDKLTAIMEKINFVEKYGLKNPFLSLIGYTVPATFNNMVTDQQITSGFMGRGLIGHEPDNNPKRKRGFIKPDMPEELRDRIMYFCTTGETSGSRVEEASQRTIVKTTPEAQIALDDAADWFEEEADKHTEKTGFEAVVRRGYELVDKLSFIMAMEERIRTLEHVEWSLKYVRRDIAYKTLLAYSNVKEKSDPVESMAAKIMCMIGESGTTAGKVINCYRSKKNLVEDAITFLEIKGKIRVEIKKSKFHKKEIKSLYKV